MILNGLECVGLQHTPGANMAGKSTLEPSLLRSKSILVVDTPLYNRSGFPPLVKDSWSKSAAAPLYIRTIGDQPWDEPLALGYLLASYT